MYDSGHTGHLFSSLLECNRLLDYECAESGLPVQGERLQPYPFNAGNQAISKNYRNERQSLFCFRLNFSRTLHGTASKYYMDFIHKFNRNNLPLHSHLSLAICFSLV